MEKSTRAKLKSLKWKVLPYSAYTPNLAQSDYYLLRSLKHFFKDKEYEDRDLVILDLEEYFGS